MCETNMPKSDMLDCKLLSNLHAKFTENIFNSCFTLVKSFLRLHNHQCRMNATLMLFIPMFTLVLRIHQHICFFVYITHPLLDPLYLSMFHWPEKVKKMIFTFFFLIWYVKFESLRLKICRTSSEKKHQPLCKLFYFMYQLKNLPNFSAHLNAKTKWWIIRFKRVGKGINWTHACPRGQTNSSCKGNKPALITLYNC